VNPFIKRMILRAAHRYGIPARILAGQEQIESSFNPGAVSSAGAFGISQFIPSTASSYGVRRGTSHRAIKSQIMGEAHYLKDLGGSKNIRLALGHYYGDPSSDYAARVLAAAKAYAGLGGGMNVGGGGGTPGVKIPGTPGYQAPTNPYLDPEYRASQMMADLGKSAGELPATQAGFQQLAQLALQRAAQKTGPSVPSLPGMKTKGTGFDMGGGGNWHKFVDLSGGADRAGMKTKGVVLRFVAEIGRMYGHPLTIGTGTNHSQMTVSGNVSDHWSGHAADIPASGHLLIKLGQLALIAAGMSRRKARKIHGGLFNVGGHQIIFNTYEGGDHTDHLHVSAY
jgi:hypothetical protein